MKKIVKMLIIVGVLLTFTLPAAASEPNNYIEEFEELLPEEYGKLLFGELETNIGPESFFNEFFSILSGKSSLFFSFFLSLVGVLAFMSLASVCPDRMKDGVQRGVRIVSSVFIGASVVTLFSETSEALLSASSFFSSAIPVMSAVTLAGGGVKGAAVGAAGMNIVLSLVGGIFTVSLSVLSGFSLAMSLSSSVGAGAAKTVSRSSKNLFLWLFGIGTALLMGTLSLQTLVASSSDSAAMRAAKYMAQSSIPIVGGTVSASLSTLAAGLSYAKGIIGAGAIFVLLLLLLSPLVMLLLYRLALSSASFLAELLGLEGEECFSSFKGCLDITLALYGLSAVLYIFEIILFIKSGVAVL